ncbi:efflux RND transporter periplasmic adaptor subunit [Chitinophagaceae bacterium MMS25-I14]
MNRSLTYIGSLFIGSAALFSCGGGPKGPQAPPPTPVNTYTVETGDATYFDTYPATITALNQVDIKPQVAGNITGVYFKDGDHVRKGQKLYSIDPQQYMGAYEQAVANLNVAKANLGKAQQDANRYQALAKNDAIAKQTLDHAMADLEAAKKQVEASNANVSAVKTNLQYATITAPFDGTIGISLVKVGTSVFPQTLLNTVSTEDPIAADIQLEQSLIPRFSAYLQKGAPAGDSTFTVTLADGSVYPSPGHIALLDRAVDPQTGTIRARIVFPNPEKMLKAGMTCNVRVQNKSGAGTLLVPYKAIIEQLGENFVYVVSNGKMALQRKVELGTRIGDKIVVRSGLQQGEEIITEGVQKLRDSSAIQIGAPKPEGKK